MIVESLVSNMSKTVFDHLSESIDQVVKGRRYIISEIGKLKVSVEDLKDALDQSTMGDVAQTVTDLKDFIQNAVQTLGQLRNSVSQLSSSISGLTSTVENTYRIVKNMKSGGGMPAARPSAPAPQPSAPAPQPTRSQPSTPPPATQPSTPAPQPSAPAPSSGGSGVDFDKVLNSAKSGTSAKELGGMIDNLRTQLSKINPLDSKLFELSMEAGRLKSLGDKPLDSNNIGTLEQKITKWKSQS